MTQPAMKKAAMAQRKATPGPLERNTVKGLSPFVYIAIAMTARDNSKMKRAAKRNISSFFLE
jgi:hypothetical protein